MALVTNRVTASALRGQGVKVTLNSSDTTTYLSTLQIGQFCEISSSSKTGTIYSVDYLGNSFIVTPISPATRFDGLGIGKLSVNDTISITIV